MKTIISLCLSAIATVFAITSLCRTYPSNLPYDFDYLGILVGVLSLLVTAVLGWQIFSVITVENRLKKLSGLYEDISTKSAEITDKLNRTEHYVNGLVSEIEATLYFKDELQDKDSTVITFADTYIRYMECFESFLKAGNTKYPALCLLNADKALTEISERVKAGEKISARFNEICDRLYNEIIPVIGVLGAGDIDFFHSVRARRQSLKSEHHNPPATNFYGIRISPNRLSKQ